MSKRTLLAEVWQQPMGGADKTVDVHLSWLRRKLGETASEPGCCTACAESASSWSIARLPTAMRRRLALLVAATTSVVLLAFLLPAAVLIARAAESERGVAGHRPQPGGAEA